MSDDQTIKSKDKKDADLPAIEPPKRSFLDTLNPGYIVAGLSSLALSWQSVGNYFFKNKHDEGKGLYGDLEEIKHRDSDDIKHGGLKERTDFAKLEDERDQKMRAIDRTPEMETARHSGDSKKIYAELKRQTNKVKTEFEGALKELEYKKWGFSKNIFVNTRQKFELLQDHQQIQIGLGVLTVFSIALGAIYSFARERHLAEKLTHAERLNHKIEKETAASQQIG